MSALESWANYNSEGYYTSFNSSIGTITIGQVVKDWRAPNITGLSPVKRIVPTVLDATSITNFCMSKPQEDRAKITQVLDTFQFSTWAHEEELNYYISTVEETFNNSVYWLSKGGSLMDGGAYIACNELGTLFIGTLFGKVETTTPIEDPITGYISYQITYSYSANILSLGSAQFIYFSQQWARDVDSTPMTIHSPSSPHILVSWGSYPIEFWSGTATESGTGQGTVEWEEHRLPVGALTREAFSENYLNNYTDFTGAPLNVSVATFARVPQYRANPHSFIYGYLANRPPLGDNQRWVSGTDIWTPSDDTPGSGSGSGGAPGSPSGGGYNPEALDTDEVGVPALPNTDVARAKLCGVYNLGENDLTSLTNWLWSSNFFDSILKNFSSPMENIIMFGTVPFSNFQGTNSAITVGNVTSEVTALKLSRTTYELDCGTIDVSMPYNSFGSFEPFCRYQLYLPYIGVVDLPSDDIAFRNIDGSIEYGRVNVIYHFDVFTGACVAYVRTCTNRHWNILSQYSGNLLTTMPISQTNYLQVYQTLIRAQASVAQMGLNTVASLANPVSSVSSIAGGASGIIGQGADTVNQLIGIRPTYGRCGSASSAHGMLSIKKPYLIKSLARFFEPELQRDNKGYISKLDVTIGKQNGFIRCQPNSTKFYYIKGATEGELAEIKTLLGQGIYI